MAYETIKDRWCTYAPAMAGDACPAERWRRRPGTASGAAGAALHSDYRIVFALLLPPFVMLSGIQIS